MAIAISMLGDFSLSQIGQPNLAQPDFHTLYKSGQCSPKHELFLDFFFFCVCHNFRWDLQPSITYENISKIFHIVYLADYSKVSTFPPLILSIWRKSFFTLWTKTVSVRPSVNKNLFCQWHLIDETIGHLSTWKNLLNILKCNFDRFFKSVTFFWYALYIPWCGDKWLGKIIQNRNK